MITSTCDYGAEFASTISKDNIFATQFHPEKSQDKGLKILENFMKNA
jgi:glutamine amidotransferase